LNTGEIADLYEKEDFERMEESLAKYMKEQGVPLGGDDIYATYIKELRLYFHIILCMSPVGDQLRVRCRNFPALVSCCTLDWFDNWPEEALRTVSKQFFEANEMVEGDQSLRDAVADMFPRVHRGTQELCIKF
jgi:dynein heavy chain